MKKTHIGSTNFEEFYIKKCRLDEFIAEKGKTRFFLTYNTETEKGDVLVLTPNWEEMERVDGEWLFELRHFNSFEITKEWMEEKDLLWEVSHYSGITEIYIEYDNDTKKGQREIWYYA